MCNEMGQGIFLARKNRNTIHMIQQCKISENVNTISFTEAKFGIERNGRR